VMDQAQYFELSRNDKLEHPVINVWNSPSGDPASLTGNILDPNKIFSVWKSQDITPRLQPLFGEVDYNKRIAGYRELDRWVVEQGYALPILMGVATVVHSKRLKYTEWRNGWPLANHWSLA
jgi:peptide/nickel transport system substrate-binding protein